MLGEHQGVFPPRLGDDGAVFHLTIPRAPGWLGGRTRGRAGGRASAQAGWAGLGGLGGGPSGSGSPRLAAPTAGHIPPPPAAAPPPAPPAPAPPPPPPARVVLPGPGREEACTEGGRAQAAALPVPPAPRSPGGSSGLLSLGPTWRIRSENKRRKWDTEEYIILSNYKRKVSCDYIIVKPSALSFQQMKVVRLLVSATSVASWNKGWATKSLNKWPLSHFALLSASELKIKIVKFELPFFTCGKNKIYSN